ncbi:MAG: glycerophosphodiester phosphodiesterase [Spirochaetota bacterium]
MKRNILNIARRKHPVIPAAVDLEKGSEGLEDLDGFIKKALKAGVQIIQYDYRLMAPEVMRELLAQGFSVWAWPVNEEETMRKVIEWGATGILTDDPPRLNGFLEQSCSLLFIEKRF